VRYFQISLPPPFPPRRHRLSRSRSDDARRCQEVKHCAAAPAACRCSPRSRGRLASRKERQVQNHLSGFILYDHHHGRIVVRTFFSQLQDFAIGIRKCRRNIRQVHTMRVILNPVRSAYYCEEISRHPNTRTPFGPSCGRAFPTSSPTSGHAWPRASCRQTSLNARRERRSD
jgi:hypothetical protein